jgi:hypothetical protein
MRTNWPLAGILFALTVLSACSTTSPGEQSGPYDLVVAMAGSSTRSLVSMRFAILEFVAERLPRSPRVPSKVATVSTLVGSLSRLGSSIFMLTARTSAVLASKHKMG